MEIITRYDNFLNVIFDIIFDNYGITPIIAIRWDIDCIYMIIWNLIILLLAFIILSSIWVPVFPNLIFPLHRWVQLNLSVTKINLKSSILFTTLYD